MYLMICTRPDLSFAVNLLSRFVNKNNFKVWEYLKGVLRYLKGTSDLKLVYRRNHNLNCKTLIGYVDSDWAADETCRRSTTGYIFKLFENCTVTWNTKKQNSVADSSTAAEYMALHEATKEAIWLKSLSESVQIEIKDNVHFNVKCDDKTGIVIYEDNNGCITIAKNESHKLQKHIDVKFHFSREKVQDGTITLKKISSQDQTADGFTKPLEATKFVEFRERLGLE